MGTRVMNQIVTSHGDMTLVPHPSLLLYTEHGLTNSFSSPLFFIQSQQVSLCSRDLDLLVSKCSPQVLHRKASRIYFWLPIFVSHCSRCPQIRDHQMECSEYLSAFVAASILGFSFSQAFIGFTLPTFSQS